MNERKMAVDSIVRNSPQYNVIGNTRHVSPYIYDYTSNAKGRWLGRKLIDVLTREFGGYDIHYWTNAIAYGHIKINDKCTTEDYIMKNGDRLLHRTHRHEPSVTGAISLVEETEDIVAVCKPASMPMHPCGSYKFNTLTSILANEPIVRDQPTLSTIHRLDRVTSGLVIMAKSAQIAGTLSREIRENSTQKVYLARVRGRFAADLSHMIQLPSEVLMAPTESAEVLKEQRQRQQRGAAADDTSACVEGRDGNDDDKVCELESHRKRRNRIETKREAKKMKADRGRNLSGPIDLAVDGVCTAESPIHEGAPCPITAAGSPPPVTEPIGYGYHSESGDLVVRCPIGVVSHREGIHACDPAGKPALSSFRCLGYCEADDTSLVECRPHTGRTHQLRLHLQLIGNSIANDPCYGGQLFFGDPERRELARAVAQNLPASRKNGQHGRSIINLPHLHHLLPSHTEEGKPTDCSVKQQTPAEEDGGSVSGSNSAGVGGTGGGDTFSVEENPACRQDGETDDEFLTRTCRYCCQREEATGSPEVEALLHCSEIWLHALSYSGKDWTFETQLPTWAAKEIFPRS